VKGLGPAAKKALLMRYGSVPTIIAAPDAELLDTPGVAARHVKALRAVFPAPEGEREIEQEGGKGGSGA
jgi:ERCC4-type nuclease